MASARPKTEKTSFLAIILIVSLATSLAAVIRLLEVALTDFPFNDGGMFTVMTQDLINNHFAIPMFTSYNLMNIPYAYSPLMFYVTAILSLVGHWPILDLIRLLPSLVSIAIVPAQYMLAYTILKSHLHATFAAFAYALSPASFVWLISGGGLTRAPGILFAVLAIHQAYLLYTSSNWRPGRVFLTATFTGLGALCHPQIAWDIACTLILFFFFCGPNRRNLVQSVIVAVLVFLLTSPWWLTIINYHGLSPILSVFRTGTFQDNLNGFLFFLLGVGFFEQVFWSFLGMLGVARAIVARQYLLPAWLVLAFVIGPRFFTAFIALPLTMLSAITIVDVFLPALRTQLGQLPPTQRSPQTNEGIASKPTVRSERIIQTVALVVFFVMMFGEGISDALNLPYVVPVYADQRQAMAWVAAHTDPKSNFVILTGRTSWALSNFAEWFPAIAQRHSIDTPQGQEWLPSFGNVLYQSSVLSECLTKTISCVEDWAAQTKLPFSYVVLDSATFNDYTMRQSMLSSPAYQLVYETANVSIFVHSYF